MKKHIAVVSIVFLVLAPLAEAAPRNKCGGRLLLTLSRHTVASPAIEIQIGDVGSDSARNLVLRVEDNLRGGWFLSVGQPGSGGEKNLLVGRSSFTVGEKIDVDAMNLPYYPDYPYLRVPIQFAAMDLCVDFSRAQVYGSGAAASFRPSTRIQIRLLRQSVKNGA